MRSRHLHYPLTPFIGGTCIAAVTAISGILAVARAQLSTGKPPAESIPPHGYVIASLPCNKVWFREPQIS